ncbi:hypothetical protein [Lentilactobacillus kosonis]|uniref:Uncharacterized protein n=1 Tax=Lentilactobacillus kosonis TaxID=2810561 RepID=A0A401FJ91_9LACO|nr:hypothetical protein [Lentilactobacillus kosonis]GAY72444.1 hypothetical protein NBRC111893_590 [Lentilactobacillus kosonis]
MDYIDTDFRKHQINKMIDHANDIMTIIKLSQPSIGQLMQQLDNNETAWETLWNVSTLLTLILELSREDEATQTDLLTLIEDVDAGKPLLRKNER